MQTPTLVAHGDLNSENPQQIGSVAGFVRGSALLAGRQYRQDFAVLQVFVNAAHRFMRRQKIHKPQHNTGASASNAPLHSTRTLPAKIFHARTKENNGNNGPSIQNQGLHYAPSVRKLCDM